MNIATTEWFALYVKSRHEFSVETELFNKGIEVFLPAVKKHSQWKDRKKLIDYPLFPGYLFVNILPKAEELLNVIRTRGVVTILSSGAGRPVPVSHAEINALKLLNASSDVLDIYPQFKEGVRVRVKRGLLKGVEGIIKKKENSLSLVINIEILGRSVGINVLAEDLEAA
jgi:transcription termination/antitermination protein NusG